MRARRASVMQFSVELLKPTHYARLGLAEDADAAAIEAAWLRLRRPPSHRADAGPTGASLEVVAWPQPGLDESPAVRARQREVAHAVLSDPGRRAVYDRWLAEHRRGVKRSPDGSRWKAWLRNRRVRVALGLLAAVTLAWLVL